MACNGNNHHYTSSFASFIFYREELEIVDSFGKALKAVCVCPSGKSFSVEIRRSNLLDDAMKEARKVKFNPKCSITVRIDVRKFYSAHNL